MFKSTANTLATIRGVKLFAFAIVASVAIYGDILYLQLMQSIFPDGVLRIFSVIGALTTAASVIALYVGKQRWFRPGDQLVWAYWFTAIEFFILAANTALLFMLHHSPALDTILQMWFYVCPVTPFISAGGWILITMLDKEQQQAHEDMELEDEMKAAERAHKLAAHQAHMQLRTMMLEQQTAYMVEEVNSQSMQTGIREAARRLAQQELKGLAGFPVVPSLREPTVVEGTAKQVPTDEEKRDTEELVALEVEPVAASNGNGHKPLKNGKRPSGS